MGFNPFSSDFWFGSKVKAEPTRYEFAENAFGTGESGEELLGTLQGRMRGQAPSVAELQMQRGIGRALQGSQAQQASSVGMSPGLAQRLAGMRAAELQGQGNLQMGQLRAQEQAAAESRLADWLERERQAQMALQMAQAGENARMDEYMLQRALANRTPGVGGILASGLGQGLGALLA